MHFLAIHSSQLIQLSSPHPLSTSNSLTECGVTLPSPPPTPHPLLTPSSSLHPSLTHFPPSKYPPLHSHPSLLLLSTHPHHTKQLFIHPRRSHSHSNTLYSHTDIHYLHIHWMRDKVAPDIFYSSSSLLHTSELRGGYSELLLSTPPRHNHGSYSIPPLLHSTLHPSFTLLHLPPHSPSLITSKPSLRISLHSTLSHLSPVHFYPFLTRLQTPHTFVHPG